MIYITLFWSFFQVGLLSFGGGYAALPLIQNQIVYIHGWLDPGEFADVVTISQMTPGPIGINAATFVGIRISGIWGALIATGGFVLPSFVIVILLAKIYYRYKNLSFVQGLLDGIRPAVTALIASAGMSLIILSFWNQKGMTGKISDIDFVAVFIFFSAFIALRKFKINPIPVMIMAGVIGLCAYHSILRISV